MSDVIQVVHGTVEATTLPEKADIIISEPMGFALFHEQMLDTFILARDKFLKTPFVTKTSVVRDGCDTVEGGQAAGGMMFPSRATVYAAPLSDAGALRENMTMLLLKHNTHKSSTRNESQRLTAHTGRAEMHAEQTLRAEFWRKPEGMVRAIARCVHSRPTMRPELIGHFEACMTEIYLHIDARMADYIRTHPYLCGQCRVILSCMDRTGSTASM